MFIFDDFFFNIKPTINTIMTLVNRLIDYRFIGHYCRLPLFRVKSRKKLDKLMSA